MNDRPGILDDVLYRHDFLSIEATQYRLRPLNVGMKVLLPTFLGALIVAGLTEQGSIKPSDFGLYLTTIGVVSFAALALAASICLAYLAHQYSEASVRSLDRLAPLLKEDPAVRTLVRKWSSQRPLQVRDVAFLSSLNPILRQRKRLAAFQKSLADPD